MSTIIFLFAVGVLLLGCEVFVPGAILGTVGGLCLLGGIGFAFVEFGGLAGCLATVAALVLTGIVLYLEFRVLPRTAWGRRLFLHASITGTSQPPPAEKDAVVGRSGETLTPLSPSGVILVDGHRYEAFSRSGLLEKGESVRVVGLDNFRLIVIKTQST